MREYQYVDNYFKMNLAFSTFTILSNDNGRFFNVY